jgi:thiamine biosynthesis lipoprotein
MTTNKRIDRKKEGTSARFCVRQVLLAVMVSSAGRAGGPLTRYEYAQLHMGVRTRLVVYAPEEATAARACTAAFQRVAELEDVMSDYRPTSELMRLCAQAGGPPVPVSEDLFLVLQRAQDLARRSGGAFDVTVGPYVALWRKARQTGQFPSEEERRRARRLVGWRKMRLDPPARTVRLRVPDMRLDLGGTAKGYAGDRALAVLKEQGVTRALFEAGGDIVVSGPPPGRRGWGVELFDARPEGDGETGRWGDRETRRRGDGEIGRWMRTLTLAHAAVSTSGDTEQFVEFHGKRYSHIVDPRTGLGLTHRLAVTVVARDGITADSLATAVSVLGPEKGPALVRSFPGASVYVRRVSGEG